MSILLMLVGCAHHSSNPSFIGAFEDEFGNKFVLNEDHSATIEYVNTNKVIPTTWNLVESDSASYATIAFNGDDHYFLVKDESSMFRHMADMMANRAAISITYSANE
jgi:hypothetical protein